jgi:hypothetical protein
VPAKAGIQRQPNFMAGRQCPAMIVLGFRRAAVPGMIVLGLRNALAAFHASP